MAFNGAYTGDSLPPDLMAALLAQMQQPSTGGFFGGPGPYVANGMQYSPVYDNQQTPTGEDATGWHPTQTGWEGMQVGAGPGGQYTTYGMDGSGGYAHPIQNGGSVGDLLKGTFKDLAPAALLFASLYGMGSLAGGGLLGAGGAGADAAGVTGLPSGADASAFWDMGPGAAGAPNTAAMGGSGAGFGAGAGGAGGAAGAGAGTVGGAGTDIFGGNGMATGFTDTGTAGGALDGGFAGSGALTGATGLVGPTGSLLDSLSGLGLGDLAKYGLPLLGGLLGSKGVKSTTTTQHDIPDWLKPYVTGQGGILDQTNALLQKQMAPGYLAGFDTMRTTGQNLMNQPIAGNGFSRMFPGR